MTTDPMPEPEGPEDERFVYVVTAAGVEALRQSAAEFDSERPQPSCARRWSRPRATPPAARSAATPSHARD